MDISSSGTLHLVMAALVGATVVAASAYYMHKRALEQLLEFQRRSQGENLEDNEEDEEAVAQSKRRGHHNSRRRSASDRTFGSMPNIPNAAAEGLECYGQSEKKLNHSNNYNGGAEFRRGSFGNLTTIPSGLPRLQTRRDGSWQSLNHPTPSKRAPMVPAKSPPATNGGAFQSMEGSEEDEALDNQDGQNYSYEDGDTVIENMTSTTEGNHRPIYPTDPDHVNMNGEQNPKAASSIIKSHSVSGDLHGIHATDPVAANILRKEPEQETFVRLNITPMEPPSTEEEEVCLMLQDCLQLRNKYVFRDMVAPWEREVVTDPCTPKPNPDPFVYETEEKTDHSFQMVNGVIQVYASKDETTPLFPVPDATTFFTDLHRILKIIAVGNVRTLCHHRLRLLEQKFSLHLMLNADREFLAQKSAPHRDFYNVRKVDTHVHHSSCMNQKHLLRFIKSKLRKEPDEVVIYRDGIYLTLKEVFESLDLTGYDLNVDLLDVHADKNTFHRFDKFNLKYNPCGQSRLREIFLKQDNLIQGRFLAELTMQVFSDLAASKYQMAEYRISIYGRKQSEWDQMASWIVNNELYSENVVWLIQLPRLYNVYKEMGIVTTFQDMLDNVFIPLFEVTIDPSSHPQLHVFLKQVVGFDMVDDESKPERRPTKHMPTPEQWTNVFNPAYSYYAYYCYANLYTLNKLRESKGYSILKFRPHCGEAGDSDHLAATFLLAHNIAHGNNLRKSPALQYLFYLSQIGLAMSPLSNNSLFLDYHKNPFPMFFARGLNVSLSTDDPLQIHLTKEPLVEEYSIAASVWKLSACDLCEIARNSVYQSGFSHALKSHWIGRNYYKRGPAGNDIHKTNVPHMRVEFRDEVWQEEMNYLFLGRAPIPEELLP
ncbi:hypothetical protein SUGI_0788790 [Cryptomeria japonica]|uniref:AMP deaminase n=1 Tax=Cryptomeria japonica TaxID=3369 RepID=UPI00241474C8|nr:AMP deaminase [Cryptomeria japonica]GLJ38699.1 hypothetical protein SUGI_0788790 [Cryptomeria japonica]